MIEKMHMKLLLFFVINVLLIGKITNGATNIVAMIGTNLFFEDNFKAKAIDSMVNKEIDSRINKLKNWVVEISAKELGVCVSAEELEREFQKTCGDNVRAQITYVMKVLPVALREALNAPDKEREIYNKYLSSSMTYEIWLGHLKNYNTVEKIDVLEKVPLPTDESVREVMPSLKEALLRRKISQEIRKNTEFMKQVGEKISDRELYFIWLIERCLSRTDLIIFDEALSEQYREWLNSEKRKLRDSLSKR